MEKYKVFGELDLFSFFFFLSHSLTLFTSLCLSASLYSAVKTPQPPSHGCHSNHLPALTSYVSVRFRVCEREPECVCVERRDILEKCPPVACLTTLRLFPYQRLSALHKTTHTHIHNHTLMHTHKHMYEHTHSHSRGFPCTMYLMRCNCGS